MRLLSKKQNRGYLKFFLTLSHIYINNRYSRKSTIFINCWTTLLSLPYIKYTKIITFKMHTAKLHVLIHFLNYTCMYDLCRDIIQNAFKLLSINCFMLFQTLSRILQISSFMYLTARVIKQRKYHDLHIKNILSVLRIYLSWNDKQGFLLKLICSSLSVHVLYFHLFQNHYYNV